MLQPFCVVLVLLVVFMVITPMLQSGQPVELPQDMRTFDFLSPWEGSDYVLPGDEKATAPAPVPEAEPEDASPADGVEFEIEDKEDDE